MAGRVQDQHVELCPLVLQPETNVLAKRRGLRGYGVSANPKFSNRQDAMNAKVEIALWGKMNEALEGPNRAISKFSLKRSEHHIRGHVGVMTIEDFFRIRVSLLQPWPIGWERASHRSPAARSCTYELI